MANKTEMDEIGNFAAKIFGFFSDFGSVVSLNAIPDDRRKECDNYSIEDCSVAPPIAIYFGEEGMVKLGELSSVNIFCISSRTTQYIVVRLIQMAESHYTADLFDWFGFNCFAFV